MRFWVWIFGLGFTVGAVLRSAAPVRAAGGPRPLEKPVVTNTAASTVKRLDGGDLMVGVARLNPKTREIVIPCLLNQTHGVIEYFLVQNQGKVHESLFKTAARPSDIHTLALLLTSEGQVGVRPFEVLVRAEGHTNSLRAESLVWDMRREKPMQPGLWSYLGSRIESGRFVAERDGSILAVINDPAALADNPRPGREIDGNWWVNTNSASALTGRVDVVFRFQ